MKVTSWDEISHYCTLSFGDLDLICLINKGTSKSLCVWMPLVGIHLAGGGGHSCPQLVLCH